jgi:nucleoside-diphosphate-sugar epimerase
VVTIATPDGERVPHQTVLVTGGTGLVGTVIVRHLASVGYHIRVLSRRASDSGNPAITTCRGDLRRPADVRAAVRGCSGIIHCAAEKEDVTRMRDVNVLSTRLLFEAAAEARVKFFGHLSSVGVVGKTMLRVVDETAPCNPMNLYEETKYLAEGVVGRGLQGGVVVVLRPTNVFDAASLRQWRSTGIRARARAFLKGNECAHLVYVDDVAAAMMYTLRHATDATVTIYNVSSDEEAGNTYRGVQAMVAAESHAPNPLGLAAPIAIPYWVRVMKHGRTNRGDVIYSSRKLRADGFAFPFGLGAGVRQAMEKLDETPAMPRGAA